MKSIALVLLVLLGSVPNAQAVSPSTLAPMVLPVLFSDTHVEQIDGRDHLVFDDGSLRITMPAIRSKDEITPISIYWYKHGVPQLKAVLYGDTFDPFQGGKWTKH